MPPPVSRPSASALPCRPATPRAAAVVVAVMVAVVPCAAGCGSLSRDDNARGVQLYQQGNYRGAVGHFQRALSRQPGSADCFYNLGATYHQQAKVYGQATDFRSAEQYYHLCLARHPDHDACRRGLANLLVEQRRSPEAVALLEDWARRRPADPNPRIELARVSAEHGDLVTAERHLDGALAVDPDNARAREALDGLLSPGGGGVPRPPSPPETPVAPVVAGALVADRPPAGTVRTVAFLTPSPAPAELTASTSGPSSAAPSPPRDAMAFPAR